MDEMSIGGSNIRGLAPEIPTGRKALSGNVHCADLQRQTTGGVTKAQVTLNPPMG